MKVYLLTADDGTLLFYSDPPVSPEMPPRPGLRGWLEHRARTIRSAWKRADRGLAGRLRRAWDWLIRRTPPDESMLVGLRLVTLVEIHHPSHLSTEQVRALWLEYLASRKRRHLPRFGVNALICPLTLLLGPLPGPNLVGYWFVYRTMRHLGAVLGSHRAASDRVRTLFHPSSALDRPLGADDRPLAGLAHPDLSRARVFDFFRRVRPSSSTFSLAGNRPAD